MKLIFLCRMKLAINLFDFKLKQIEIHVRTYVCVLTLYECMCMLFCIFAIRFCDLSFSFSCSISFAI